MKKQFIIFATSLLCFTNSIISQTEIALPIDKVCVNKKLSSSALGEEKMKCLPHMFPTSFFKRKNHLIIKWLSDYSVTPIGLILTIGLVPKLINLLYL